jgi:hypothetical protein
MCWNVSLKKSNENSRSWFGSYYSKKSGKTSSDLKCRLMRAKVALKDVGARKNGARTRAA